MRRQWATVLMIATVLVVVFFAVLNVDPVLINFGFRSVEIPLVLVIIGTLLIGVLIAVMWSTTLILRERNQVKKLNQQMEKREADFDLEKKRLEEKHQGEKRALQENIDNITAEKRELNRRIHNLETTRTIHKKQPTNGQQHT